ncbi:MAG: ABC transporter ATP-binding protein [Candidatus Zixiibacteriota bacterium]
MIELRNVTFSYTDEPVLNDVSFVIPEGESRIIMGQSGSGKSTILKLLLGLLRPDSGDALIDNEKITGMKESELRRVRMKMGMVFQEGALFDSQTVGENVGFYLIEHTENEIERVEERVREMLGFVGLDESIIDRLPDELSGGMQRRVSIARALLSTNPKIMLYDEPTTGLDPESTTMVIDLMNKLTQARRIATIVVTHQFLDAIEVSDKFILIDKGAVAFDGGLPELRDSTDPRVLAFLEPFRESLRALEGKEFS